MMKRTSLQWFCVLLSVAVLAANTSATAAPGDNNAAASSSAAAGTTESNIRTLVWPDGTRYVGSVANGKRSGKGTIFWQDGTRFVGTFKDDLRNGPGTLILPDGTVYNGFFENDILVDNQVAGRGSEIVEPETSAAMATLDTETRQALEDAINQWAKAWSRQDIAAYLNSYDATFAVPDGQTRGTWEALRKSRVQQPKRIEVKVDITAMALLSADAAQVSFTQTYASDSYSDASKKIMQLVKQGDLWLITRETTIAEDDN
jgi:ketosteroid isomerase-like protein